MPFRRTLEMSIQREEFFRLLPGALGAYEEEGGTVRWTEGGGSGTIRLARLEGRPLGNLVLPRHTVEVELKGWTEAEGEAFMARFHRAFLRGGG